MSDCDIREAFARALPSQEWRIKPLVVAFADIGDWRPYLPDASTLLDDVEDLRIQRKHRKDDRELLTLAYAMHRLLLGRILGMEPTVVPLWRDAAGCPRVGDNLVHTSLSHARDRIALAVSRVGPVGVDIEPLVRVNMLAEMAYGICDPSELAGLEAHAVDQRGSALLALWVRKEALLKAAGTGLSVEMNSFAAPEGPVPPMPMLAKPTWLEMLETESAYLAALARSAGATATVVRIATAAR